jgi:DNA-binding NtrC family response regulator
VPCGLSSHNILDEAIIMLNNRRILVVEDEFMIAEDICTALEDAGAIVIGPVSSVQQALDRIEVEQRIDGAVLDVSLDGENSFSIADALASRHVPFLFASGYGDDAVSNRYPDAISCPKPFDMPVLINTIYRILPPD